jgi:hypothetical protein
MFPPCKSNVFQENYKVTVVSWNFFAISHGKSAPDEIGGTIN